MTDDRLKYAVQKLKDDEFLVLEDIDSTFAKKRDTRSTHVTFSGLLNVLDGIVKKQALVVFMTTNFLKNIDDVALNRRVDFYMKFDTITPEQVREMFTRFFPNQDADAFCERVKGLKMTPCVLQKFFIRRLRVENVIEEVTALVQMCEQEYRVVEEKSSLYM